MVTTRAQNKRAAAAKATRAAKAKAHHATNKNVKAVSAKAENARESQAGIDYFRGEKLWDLRGLSTHIEPLREVRPHDGFPLIAYEGDQPGPLGFTFDNRYSYGSLILNTSRRAHQDRLKQNHRMYLAHKKQHKVNVEGMTTAMLAMIPHLRDAVPATT